MIDIAINLLLLYISLGMYLKDFVLRKRLLTHWDQKKVK